MMRILFVLAVASLTLGADARLTAKKARQLENDNGGFDYSGTWQSWVNSFKGNNQDNQQQSNNSYQQYNNYYSSQQGQNRNNANVYSNSNGWQQYKYSGNYNKNGNGNNKNNQANQNQNQDQNQNQANQGNGGNNYQQYANGAQQYNNYQGNNYQGNNDPEQDQNANGYYANGNYYEQGSADREEQRAEDRYVYDDNGNIVGEYDEQGNYYDYYGMDEVSDADDDFTDDAFNLEHYKKLLEVHDMMEFYRLVAAILGFVIFLMSLYICYLRRAVSLANQKASLLARPLAPRGQPYKLAGPNGTVPMT